VNYTRLDETPLRPGYGLIFQGAIPDYDLYNLPGPLVIVNMMQGHRDESWLHESRDMTRLRSNGKIQAVLAVCIEDNPISVLPDNVYLALVDSCISYLKQGINLYVHCRMGFSRSSYLTAGIYIRHGLTLKQATRHISTRRKTAFPNNGFYEHLLHLTETGQLTSDSPKAKD
jgi:protein-tyrosine phosphatase